MAGRFSTARLATTTTAPVQILLQYIIAAGGIFVSRMNGEMISQMPASRLASEGRKGEAHRRSRAGRKAGAARPMIRLVTAVTA
jgi:hypothetical protein